MKRQIISTIAAVAVIVAALTGCSGNKENSSQSTTTSSSTTSVESSSTTTESSSSTAESTESTSESAPESTSEPASTSESKTGVVKKTITLDDGFGEIEVPLENKGVNQYLQKLYDKKIIPEGTYAGTEILINEEGTEACIIFSGNSVNHGNVPVYDFGFTTDWEPTPIEEDDKIWDDIIVPDYNNYVEKAKNKEIGFIDFNKNGTSEAFEASIISILSSDAFELRGIIYL